VCGHVLAWCDRLHTAYICPAEVLMEDMKRTLGANRICLPGAFTSDEKVPQPKRLSIEAKRNSALAQGVDGVPDLSKLGISERGEVTATVSSPQASNSAASTAGAATLNRRSGNVEGRMFRSVLNGEANSPRLEVTRLFGGEIAR
jgi:hypothetical protein